MASPKFVDLSMGIGCWSKPSRESCSAVPSQFKDEAIANDS